MTKYNIPQIEEHIQWLMRFMQAEYPNNYEIVIGSAFAQIRNVQREMSFMREDMNPENIHPSKEEIDQANEKMWDMMRDLFFWKPNRQKGKADGTSDGKMKTDDILSVARKMNSK